MDNAANLNGMQPTLNPNWKEALDKAMHQSLMRGRSTPGVEKQDQRAKGTRNPKEDDDDDDDSITLSDNDSDTLDDGDEANDDDVSLSDENGGSVAPALRASMRPAPAHASAAKPSKGPEPPPVVYGTPGETTDSVKARLEQNRSLQREEKMELLGRLHYFMDEKGFRPFKVLGPEDSLEDIRYEVFRAQRELSKRRNVKFMQKALVSAGAGLEMANSMYNPLGLRLDGFSKSLLLSIKDYDEIFEELHWKYCDAVSMPPELRLVMTLGSSIFFYHLSNNGPVRSMGTPMSPPSTHPHPSVPQPPPPPPVPSAEQHQANKPSMHPQQRKMAGPRTRMAGVGAGGDGEGNRSGPAVDMTSLMSGLSMVKTLMNH